MRYAIVIEKPPSNYSAYCPDLPGCVATGYTIEEVKNEMTEAITFHLVCFLITQITNKNPILNKAILDRGPIYFSTKA